MSQLLKSFLTWSAHVSSTASPQNSAMGSDLISIKSAKDNTECQSLFCVLCLCVPCQLSSRPTIFLFFLSSFCCQCTLTSLSQLQLSLGCFQLKQCFSLLTKCFSYLCLLSASTLLFVFWFFLTYPEILC